MTENLVLMYITASELSIFDTRLSKYLEKDFTGFDVTSTNTMDISPVERIAPHPSIMEVESASKMD